MTSSFPNVPLWPRGARFGRRAAAALSSRVGTAVSGSVAGAAAAASRRPNPSGRDSAITGLGEGSEALHPGKNAPLAVVEPSLDVRREQEPAADGPHAERDRHRVLGLMADREGDPVHPELLGALGGAAVQLHGRLAGGKPLDLDLLPADGADGETEDP